MRAYLESEHAASEENPKYYCAHCERTYDYGDHVSRQVIYAPQFVYDAYCQSCHDGHEDDCCSYVYIEKGSGTVENAWFCGSGCFHHDEGPRPNRIIRTVQVWVCGECGEKYRGSEESAKDAAITCCQ